VDDLFVELFILWVLVQDHGVLFLLLGRSFDLDLLSHR